ncbi:uncharacterized protein V1510DRAFT_366689, partial [Dipodascopsis tothii]|uniref:uncharacterized protein n=1 Tax=Dipodascopsis tothii TaxID=44089 RepID=UPI0034CFEA85
EPFPSALLHVSRLWHLCALPLVYRAPELGPENYLAFVVAISTSQLGSLVRVLNLRNIIQSGKNSYTSRLLRRCCKNLEEFYAPQTSFGYAPLVSIRHCTKLRVLDLSLVSETVDLRELFVAISNLQSLSVLHFPRSSVFCADFDDDLWPPSLATLGLAGGISEDFVKATAFPPTIKSLSFAYCPMISYGAIEHLLDRIGPGLTAISVLYPMPGLTPLAMNAVLAKCPNLRRLTISTDYVSQLMLSDENVPPQHPLRILELDYSGQLGQAGKIKPFDIAIAVLEDRVPHLRVVRASIKLGWNKSSEDVCDLAAVLDDQPGGGLWIV